MYKRIAILLLIILLFGSSISYAELAAGRASDETIFEVALEDLKQYRDVQSVCEAEEMFGQIMSGYNNSSMFKMYAGAIGNVLEGSFADAELVLGRLAERGSFAKLLKEYGLPSCENLIRYVKARTAEAAGDYAAASEIYADLDVFDSIERLIGLDVQHEGTQAPRYAEAEAEFAAGHYAAAAEIWRELGDYRDSAERMAEAMEFGATPSPTPSPEPTPVPIQNETAHKVGVPAFRREEFSQLALRTGPHTEFSWVGMYGGSDFSALELEKTTEYNKDTGEYEEFTWVLIEYNNDGKICRAYTGLKRMILNENIPWATHDNIPAQVNERTTVLAAPSSNARIRWITGDNDDEAEDYTQAVVEKNQKVTVLEYEDDYAYIEFIDAQTSRKTRGYILSLYLA